ncbi:10969_t:CDS:2, partial [Scutellospora calospora]
MDIMSTNIAKESSIFEVWMLREPDTIHALAKAHGSLYALSIIDSNLAWYITNNPISVGTASIVEPLIQELVAELASILSLVNRLDLMKLKIV